MILPHRTCWMLSGCRVRSSGTKQLESRDNLDRLMLHSLWQLQLSQQAHAWTLYRRKLPCHQKLRAFPHEQIPASVDLEAARTLMTITLTMEGISTVVACHNTIVPCVATTSLYLLHLTSSQQSVWPNFSTNQLELSLTVCILSYEVRTLLWQMMSHTVLLSHALLTETGWCDAA